MKTLKLGLLTAFALGSLIVTGPVVARRGADNHSGDVRGPRNDDAANHNAADNRGQDVNDANDVNEAMEDVDVLDLDDVVNNQMNDNHHRDNDGMHHHHH